MLASGRFPKRNRGKNTAPDAAATFPPKWIKLHIPAVSLTRRGGGSSSHITFSRYRNTGGKPHRWRVSVSLQTGVCPSVELSPPELAFFHWTKCRKKEERPREDGREGERGPKTPPPPPPPSTVTDGKTLSLLTGGNSHPCLPSLFPSVFLAQKPSK